MQRSRPSPRACRLFKTQHMEDQVQRRDLAPCWEGVQGANASLMVTHVQGLGAQTTAALKGKRCMYACTSRRPPGEMIRGTKRALCARQHNMKITAQQWLIVRPSTKHQILGMCGDASLVLHAVHTPTTHTALLHVLFCLPWLKW